MCWAACCLLWSMLLIYMTQRAGYLPQDERINDIHLSRSSAQTLDIGALLFLIRRNNLVSTLIFQRKSSPTSGRSSLGAGWLNAPSPGSTIPDASVKIMRFPSPPLRQWSKFPIFTLCLNAYEYSFSSWLKHSIPDLRRKYSNRNNWLRHIRIELSAT